MARSRPDKANKKRKKGTVKTATDLPPVEKAQLLLDQATYLLQTGQPDEALPVVKKCIQCLSSPSLAATHRLPALERLAEIYIELGEVEKARTTFEEAVDIDPTGEIPDKLGGGADKFLWLAQLCEEGGHESIAWFEKGIAILRQRVGDSKDALRTEEDELSVEESKSKLANALCGAAEVYMTDLSWEDDAEARCEALVTEACLVAPNDPEPLQTLASVRISQTKLEDARAALGRSLELWQHLQPEDSGVPGFPTRISLARLLMEAEMEDKALDVLERLVAEDDNSVEAWYLGGWCQYLLGQGNSNIRAADMRSTYEGPTKLLKNSREWLENSLRLYAVHDYEDDRLRDHAEELVKELNDTLGTKNDGEDQEDEDEWEDEEDEGDDDVDDDHDDAMEEMEETNGT